VTPLCHLDEARCVFLDGPVALYICEASSQEILEALSRVHKLGIIAALEMGKEKTSEQVELVLKGSKMAQKSSGFGLAKVKIEGELADPDDFDWEHDPFDGDCVVCRTRYQRWKKLYDEQEQKKKESPHAPPR